MKQKLWCCVCTIKGRQYYDYSSLRPLKSDSVKIYDEYGWEKMQKTGWKCIRVEVEIKPINEVK
jgi:hypothetical protein